MRTFYHTGGHPMAAGITLNANITQLRNNLNEQAKKDTNGGQLVPKLSIDVPLSTEEINVEVLEGLEFSVRLVWGLQNLCIYLKTYLLYLYVKLGRRNHMKLELTDGDENT